MMLYSKLIIKLDKTDKKANCDCRGRNGRHKNVPVQLTADHGNRQKGRTSLRVAGDSFAISCSLVLRLNKCTFHFCKQTLCKMQRKSVKIPRRTVDTDFQRLN